MRDTRIADLGSRAPHAAVRVAGRIVQLKRGAAHLCGRIADASGRCRFRADLAADLRRGDLAALAGRAAAPDLLLVDETRLLVRPARDPCADPEQRRLSRPALRRALERRALLARVVRSFFDERGFLEVETGQLVDEPGQEPTLEPFFCGGRALITSPELRMKRLLAAGFERIYELSHCFRSGLGERSPLHHPEFTLLEWYRAYEGADALIRDMEGLFARCAERVAGRAVLRQGGAELALAPPFERLTVREAFLRHAGVDLEPFLDGDDAAFRRAARRAGFAARRGEDGESLFFRVLLERVEPRLGRERPALLTSYPARMAALARLDAEDARVCQRFECYAFGIELANAFVELNDPLEQRRRFAAERERKRAAGLDPGPFPERFLNALERGMPPAAGAALGFDRLLMLVCGAQSIDEFIPFPDPL
ncbi:MAG: EF-P lysine aminoacylase GenX [Planctomycetes bacterium]|nr:EF-P lysine aminoacylase GenX [Planctomycetota bacterium]